MRIGLVELLLIPPIDTLYLRPSAAHCLERWTRRAQLSPAPAPRRTAAPHVPRAAASTGLPPCI